MHIPPEDFRWYAAFHDEGGHPHVHMMAWSKKPGQAYLNRDGIRKIKSVLTNQIFQQELLHIYTIVGVAAEHGSGLTLDRPALQELTEAVLAGKVDVVLVNSLDRLGRDWGMTKQYIDLLTEHKVKLLCVRERMMIDSSSFSPFFT